MVASPPLVSTYKSAVVVTSAPSVASAVFSAGDWVYVIGQTADSIHVLGTPTGPPVGNPGWTLLQSKGGADAGSIKIWYAKVTANWTGTLSIPITTQGNVEALFRAYRYDSRSSGLGASASADPSVNGGSGVLSLNITTQQPDSAILWGGNDWLAQAWTTPSFRLPSGSSAAVNDGHGHVTRMNWVSAHHDDAGPAGVKNVGLTTPTNWRTIIGAVEVLGDVTVPSGVPNIAAVLASDTSVTITWDVATDNAGIASYKVYDNGVQIADIPVASPRSYTHSGLASESSHLYTVRAVDTSGNIGAVQSSVPITTPARKLKLGTVNTDFRIGSTLVSEIYLGSTRLWSR